jgi:hypothetical protein
MASISFSDGEPPASKKQKVDHDPPNKDDEANSKTTTKILCSGQGCSTFCFQRRLWVCEQEYDANDEMKHCSGDDCDNMLCSKCSVKKTNLYCKNQEIVEFVLTLCKETQKYNSVQKMVQPSSCKTSHGLCRTCHSVEDGLMHHCSACDDLEVCVNGINSSVCNECFKVNPWPSKCDDCHSECPDCPLADGRNKEKGTKTLLCYSCYLENLEEMKSQGWEFPNC